MKGFVAFTKKEFLEQLRTFRLLIMLSVFFLIGMTSPLLAKLMPEMIKNVNMQGITINMPEPTAIDAYGQFFKNLTQTCFLVVLLVFGGVLSGELTRGTLINILAKGLRRHTVILAKYFAALVLWTVSFLLSCLTNQIYTAYLFDVSEIKNLVFSLFCLWLFGAFILALIFLSSTLTGGNFGGLILTAVTLMLLLLLDIFPAFKKISPVYLASHNAELLTGSLSLTKFTAPLLITAVLTAACIYTSALLFDKKRL